MDLTQITGYRANENGTETLAWQPREDGTVECIHEAPKCCAACVEADSRLSVTGSGTVVASVPAWQTLNGRTVAFAH